MNSTFSRIVAWPLFLLFAIASSTEGATVLGSTTGTRLCLDTALGTLCIYAGGTFDAGLRVETFTWYGYGYTDARYMTPILFEITDDSLFIVRGVGAGRMVSQSLQPQECPFSLQYGTDSTENESFTFGFTNALVDPDGVPFAFSEGMIDLTACAPIDSGYGVGGPGTTNRWVFVPGEPGDTTKLVIALGTTFGIPGSAAMFILNDPLISCWHWDRTYSATLGAANASIAPSTAPSGAPGIALAIAYPNPFAERATIRFCVPTSMESSVSILDVAGRIVKTFTPDLYTDPGSDIIWDGISNGGVVMPDGVYFCRIRGQNHSVGLRLVLVRGSQ